MSRIPTWLVWILGALLVLILLSPGIHLARNHFECPSCASTRTISQWRWGAYWPERSLEISQSWEGVTLSKFYTDWLSTGHPHNWLGTRRSGTYAFGIQKASRTIYGIEAPEWLKDYERDAGFRGWILNRVSAGDLSQADLLAAAVPDQFSKYKLLKARDRWYWEYEESLKPGH